MKIEKVLFETKICRNIKLRYKIVFSGLLAAVFTTMLYQSNAFLSKDVPISSKVLVIEGWLPDYALEKITVKYNEGAYTTIITTGGPLAVGSYLKEYKDYAHLAKATLIALGIKEDDVIAVPTPDVKRDRTYHSALALKKWIQVNRIDIETFNLASLGPHARRSSILFEKAFSEDDDGLQKKIEIGSIAIEPEEYDPKRWYATSAGVRTTINELIAYMYVLLLK